MKHRLKHPRCLAKFLLHSFHTTSRWSQTIGEIANHRPIHIPSSQQTRFISETILRNLMPTAYPLERIRSTFKVRKEGDGSTFSTVLLHQRFSKGVA